MRDARIALLYIDLRDFAGSCRILCVPMLYDFPRSVGSFSWNTTAAVLVGSMHHDFFEYLNECMMHALIRKESRNCDDTLFLLDSIVDFTDRVLMRSELFCDKHLLQLPCVLVQVVYDSLNRWPVHFMLRCILDCFLQIIDVYNSLEEVTDSLCVLNWFHGLLLSLC